MQRLNIPFQLANETLANRVEKISIADIDR